MKTKRLLIAGLIGSACVTFSASLSAGSPDVGGRPVIVRGDYLIRQNPGSSAEQTISTAEKQTGSKIKLLEDLHTDNLLRIRVLSDSNPSNPKASAQAAAKETYSLSTVSSIESIEPVVEFRLTNTANDVSTTSTQIKDVMSRIGFVAIPGIPNSPGKKPIIIAVIDTGVLLNHEVFKGIILPGIDITKNGGTAAAQKLSDGTYESHGTTTAGIIALMIRGGKIDGPPLANIKILPIRATSSDAGDQRISSPDLIKAITYAIKNGAQVINASFGDVANSQDVESKIAAAASANILLCAAAGNGTQSSPTSPLQGYNIDVTPFYPASYRLPNVIPVAALSLEDSLAPFSNWGPKSVLIAAPGESIVGPVPLVRHTGAVPSSGYAAQSGTSISTPFVTGAIGIFIASHPGADDNTIPALLMSSAKRSDVLKPYINSSGELFVRTLLSEKSSAVPNVGTMANTSIQIPAKLVITEALTAPVSSQMVNVKTPTLRGIDSGGNVTNTSNVVHFLVKLNPGQNPDLIKKSSAPAVGNITNVQKVDANLFDVRVNAPLGIAPAQTALKKMQGVKDVEQVKTYQLQ